MLTPFGLFVYRLACGCIWLGAKLFWRVRYFGVENIPREGPLILASNHASHLDPPIVGIGVPQPVSFIAKAELFRMPIPGWFLRLVGQIGVERGGGGRKALIVAQKCLEEGGTVIIFPEGTRSATGRVMRGRSGISVLALKTGCPVVPVGITGTHKAFHRGMKVPRPGRVTVTYGKPRIFEKGDSNGEAISRSRLDEITAEIMLEIQRLLPEEMRARKGEVPDAQFLDDFPGSDDGALPDEAE